MTTPRYKYKKPLTNLQKEKGWDDRAFLGRIPPYDAHDDPNCTF